MEAWQVALLAMSIYLFLAFALGLAAGRGRSLFSITEYAVGDRGFSLFVMWFLMGGTIFSAFAFLGGPGWAYSKGAASLYILAYCTLGLLPWYIIGPKIAKLGRESNYITMGDFLGDRYKSKFLIVIVGIVSLLSFTPYLALQIKGMAYIFNVLTYGHIPFWLGALIAFGIVVIYVATSGVRGAAWSDVFQAILMLIVAWILGIYFVETLHGGLGNMFKSIAENDPNFLTIGKEGSALSSARYSSNILVSMLGFLMWPHLFTKSYTTTERRIKLTVVAYPLFAIFLLPVLFIGFSAIGVVPPDALNAPDEVLPYLITHHLTDSGLLYGLVGAGALAAAMSSSDAITHGASVSFGRDICKVIFPKIKENTELWIMRGAVLGVGIVAYCSAIFGSGGLIALLLGAYGNIVQLVPAVYAGLFWKKASALGIILGIIVGILVNLYYQYPYVQKYFDMSISPPYDLHPGSIGLVINIIIVAVISFAKEQDRAVIEHASKFIDD